MKRIALCLLSLCLLLSLTACQKQTSDKELMSLGMDLIATMNEMVHSEDYQALLSINTTEAEKTAGVIRIEEGAAPTAVYRITKPSEEQLLRQTLYIDTEEGGRWSRLSDNLKEQIMNKASFGLMLSRLNSYHGGTTKLAAASLYQATDRNEDLVLDEDLLLLYTFADGTPIAVIFEKDGSIYGQFLFLEEDDSADFVRQVFEAVGCTVTQIK